MARYVDIECDAVTEVLPRRAFKTRQDIQAFLDNIPTKPTDSFWQPELDIQKSYCRCCGRARSLVQIGTKIK